MSRASAAAPLLLLALAACRPASADLPVDTEQAVVQAITAQFDSLRAAVLAQQWDALGARLAGGDMAVATIDGVATTGRDRIVARLREDRRISERLEFTFGETRITPLGPDAALHTTSVQEQLVLRSRDTVQATGTWTTVFRRSEGRWRIVHLAMERAAPLPER
jgi:ketosteroid isomerase-like protein